ncbi:hypothetical protein ACIRNU_09560 [Streptomyces rochei]
MPASLAVTSGTSREEGRYPLTVGRRSFEPALDTTLEPVTERS